MLKDFSGAGKIRRQSKQSKGDRMAPTMEEQAVDTEPVGLRLALIRRRQNRTGKEVAAKSGISYQGLSLIEQSHRIPRRETLQNICDALNVAFEEVVSGTREEEKYRT